MKILEKLKLLNLLVNFEEVCGVVSFNIAHGGEYGEEHT